MPPAALRCAGRALARPFCSGLRLRRPIARPWPHRRPRAPLRHAPWSSFPASGIRAGGRSGPICPASDSSASSPRSTIRRSTIAGPDGNPAGFNVDLARLICEEIKVSCTIQMRRFDTLLDALNDNRGDAVIASIAATAGDARAASISAIPITARRRASWRGATSPIDDVLPERLEGKKVAVVAGTAHEAYLKALFTEAEVRAYPNAEAARAGAAQRRRRSVCSATASRSPSGSTARIRQAAAASAAGPFWRAAIFGEGVGIAVKTRQRPVAAGAQLGAVPALGEGPLHRPVAALFPDQPVLSRSEFDV